MKNQTGKKVESDLSAFKMNGIKRFFFICLLVIIPLAILELLSFTYIKLTREKGTFRERVKHVANPYHPYLGYVHAPNATYNISKANSGKGTFLTDANGYSITPSFSYSNPDMTIGDLMIISLVNKLRYWSYTFDFLYRRSKVNLNLRST